MNKHKPAGDYDIGYKKPPPEHRFRPGVSGNPSGRRRPTSPVSIGEAIRNALYEPLRNASGRRTSMNRRRHGVRVLIKQAIKGDDKALLDLIRLREDAGNRRAPIIKKVSFQEARKSKGDKLTEEFFEKQDREVSEIRQQLKRGDIPFGELIDQELARRISGTRRGKPAMIPAVEQIGYIYANKHAEGDGRMIKMLQKLIPEKRTFERQRVVEEVVRPTEEELADIQRQREAHEREVQDILNKDEPTMAELIKAGKWKEWRSFTRGRQD